MNMFTVIVYGLGTPVAVLVLLAAVYVGQKVVSLSRRDDGGFEAEVTER